MAAQSGTEITGTVTDFSFEEFFTGKSGSEIILGGNPPDSIAPILNNFSPAPDSQITRLTPIGFDAVDSDGHLRVVVIMVKYPVFNFSELVFDGVAFTPQFASLSTATSIGNGNLRFSVLRQGGWPDNPTFRGIALDSGGNEN